MLRAVWAEAEIPHQACSRRVVFYSSGAYLLLSKMYIHWKIKIMVKRNCLIEEERRKLAQKLE